MSFLQTFIADVGWFALIIWLAALGSFILWRKTGKPLLIYFHFALLFLPFFVFATRLPCEMGLLSSLASFCSIMWTKLLIYLIPLVVVAGITAGYFLLPRLYQSRHNAKPLSSRWIKKLTQSTGVKHAQFFWFDSAEPIAFTSGKKVFVSQGIFELLNRKELEAVLLHELYHVQFGSSWLKFSSIFGRAISPVARFMPPHSRIVKEELGADNSAGMLQGTMRYVQSARQKINEYQQTSSGSV